MACAGTCVNPITARDNCGTWAASAPPRRLGSGGACVADRNAAGGDAGASDGGAVRNMLCRVPAGGGVRLCADLATDRENCGAWAQPLPPRADVLRRPLLRLLCAVSRPCVDRCVDRARRQPQLWRVGGNARLAGNVCADGRCQLVPRGLTDRMASVDQQNDPTNCGACGKRVCLGPALRDGDVPARARRL